MPETHFTKQDLPLLRGTDSDISYFVKMKKKKKKVKPDPLNWSGSMFPILWNGCGPVQGQPSCLALSVT